MRYLILLFGCILLSCKSKQPQYDVVRKTPKQALIPPGTIWLRDNLFMDETETRNLDYLEFLSWTMQHHSAEYHHLIPDTLCWTHTKFGSRSNTFYYLRHPAYLDYPLVGISYQQAVMYCQWRTERVNEYLYLKEKHIKWRPNTLYNFPKKVVYRLPTEEEWDYAAAASLDFTKYPLGYEKLTDKKNRPVSNTLENVNMNKRIFGTDLNISPDSMVVVDPTTKVFYGKPNKFGFFNMLGNVSEIVADSLYKGLNYSTYLDGSPLVKAPQNYTYRTKFRFTKPEPWLGFRCVCEVLK
jgi:formylglycine-generating enzyme required for sulfatase activity